MTIDHGASERGYALTFIIEQNNYIIFVEKSHFSFANDGGAAGSQGHNGCWTCIVCMCVAG